MDSQRENWSRDVLRLSSQIDEFLTIEDISAISKANLPRNEGLSEEMEKFAYKNGLTSEDIYC